MIFILDIFIVSAHLSLYGVQHPECQFRIGLASMLDFIHMLQQIFFASTGEYGHQENEHRNSLSHRIK